MVADPDKMTFDVLTSVYRVEKSSSTLSQIRKDFYTAAQELLIAQTKECERLVLENPDSVLYDGAMSRKKKIIEFLKKVVDLRMNKIASMAVRGAEGANNSIEELTPEERAYYAEVLEASKRIWSVTDVRKKKVVTPDITQPIERPQPAPVAETVVKETVPAPEKISVEKEPVVEPAVEIPVKETVPVAEVQAVPVPVSEPEPAEVKEPAAAPVTEEKKTVSTEPVTDDIPLSEIPVDDEPMTEEETVTEDEEITEVPTPHPEEQTATEQEPSEPIVTIRVLEDIPAFSGPERNYTLVKEDIVRMPSMIAQVLINRGMAVLIS